MRAWVLLAVLAGVAAARAQTPPPPAPADQELIYQGEATSVLGRTVREPAGDSIGRIVDVLVDEQGQPRAAVIDLGGFMGLGNRRIAVTWKAMRFLPASDRGQIQLLMTEDQFKEIPDYKRPTSPSDPPLTVAVPPHTQ